MTDTQKIRQLDRQIAELEADSNADIHKKIDLLNDLAWALSDTEMKRAYALAEEAYTLANSINDGELPYQIGIAYSLRTQGYLNQRFGDYPLGLTQLIKAQEMCESLPLNDGLADTFDGIAGIYFQIGNFPESLDYIYKQLEVAQRIGDKRRIANAFNNLANIYFETGEYERAIETLNDNLDLAVEIDYKRIEFLSYANLAETYLLAGNYERVLEIVLSALAISQEAGFELFEVYSLDLIGKAYLKLGDTTQAIQYLERALASSRKVKSKVTESLILLNLGQAYRDSQQLDLALDHLQQSVTVAESIEAKSELFKGHLALSECYEQMGDNAQALHHFKQHQIFKELVSGEKADQRLKVLQVAHDTETAKKEAEIAQLRTVELQQEIAEQSKMRTQLQRQIDYERALALCSQILLSKAESEASQQQTLNQALEHLLVGSQASRAYIFRNIQDPDLGPCLGIVAEASAPGIEPQLPNPANHRAPWTRMPAIVFETLQAGEPIGGPVETLFANLPDELELYRNQIEPLFSLQLFPIFIRGQWWGFVGFDDCLNVRQWGEQEISMLGTASEMIASTLLRWQAEEKVRSLNQQLEKQVKIRTSELNDTITLLQNEIAVRERAEAEIQQMVELLEQRVADRSRELAALYDMTILFTEAQNLTDILTPALHNICNSVDGDAIAVHILDADNIQLQLAAQLSLSDWDQLQQVALAPIFADWLQQAEGPEMLVGYTDVHPVLPPEILPSGYQTYFGIALRVRNEVIGMLGVYREQERPFSVQNVSFLITMAEQLGIIIQNHRLLEQSRYMTRVIERQRLARELHDSVAQRIYSLNLFARAGQDAIADGDLEDTRLRLEQVEENALDTLREMRLLLYQLRPLALENQTLIDAIEERFALVERRLGIEAVIEANVALELMEALEEDLYFIITEALNNSLKHAQATRVELRFERRNDHLLITIRDNGQGFDPQQQQPGLGMENLCLRATKIDGLIDLETAVGQGTTIRLTV